MVFSLQFPYSPPPKKNYEFLISPMYATCPTDDDADFITPVILDVEYKLRK
jgi:hypothetical protein